VCLYATTTPTATTTTTKTKATTVLNNQSRGTTVPFQMQITSTCLSETSVKSKINTVTESYKYMRNEHRNKHEKDR